MSMDYSAILEYLKERDMTMSRYEREDWDHFVEKIHLQLSVPFIHITGSNGKGSTANYLYQIYQAAGYKTALFSKPYFYKVNEMIQINGKTILDADFARIFTAKEKEIKASNLSSFEIETYIAFAYLNEQKPDIAIIECGMGGATDSTNLPEAIPLLSIITTISLEHTAFLGRTVSEIALNKGGIIKKDSPILVGQLEESADNVIKDIAKRQHSLYYRVDAYHNEVYDKPHYRFEYQPYKDLEILTPAKYQLGNASMAVEAVKILEAKLPVSEDAIRHGLLSKPLPCRMERHHNIVLDGAHNPEAVEALMNSLVPMAEGKPIHVVFASLRDKNIAVELPRIDRDVAEIVLTTFPSERARNEEDYFLYEGDYSFNPDYKEVITNFLVKYPDDYILITGSLAFAALAKKYVEDELRL
jgi:dihydrofolate synthase / folylpolyglutamate synthase